jgi:hypothetical protein
MSTQAPDEPLTSSQTLGPDSKEPGRKRRKVVRSRAGCLVCRKRRKACDMTKPQCGTCVRLKMVSQRPLCGETYQQDCCWPSGKPNEASRNPAPPDCSLYGLALASSSSLPVPQLAGLTGGEYSSGGIPHALPSTRHSAGSWYDNSGSNQYNHIQLEASLSPIAGTSLAQIYPSGEPSQAQLTSTGLTPYVNVTDSPVGGQVSSATPQQLDSIFSGIDFSEVSLLRVPLSAS